MKWVNIILAYLLCTASAVHADDGQSTPLTMDFTSLSTGARNLSWSDDNMSILTSWQLDFTLSCDVMASGEFFWTRKYDSTFKQNRAIIVAFDDSMGIQLHHGGQIVADSDESWFDTAQQCKLSLQFILYKNSEGDIENGVFTVSSQNNSLSYVMEDSALVEYSYLQNPKDLPNSAYAYITTHNGSFEYSNITLSYLESRVIPEPSTCVFVCLSLIIIGGYRRR